MRRRISITIFLTVFVFFAYNHLLSISRAQTNNPPVAVGDSYSGNAARGQAAPGVKGNDYDPDGNSFTVSIVTQATNGSVSLNSNGAFSYSPNIGYTGDDSFVYKACDPSQACSQATVTLIAANTAPTTSNETYTGNDARSQPAPGVLANDTDPNGDSLQLGRPWSTSAPPLNAVITGPSNGTLTLNSNGSFSYSPNIGYTGDDSFVYRVCDSKGACTEATTTLISPNTAPNAVGESYSGNATRNQPAPGLLANDSDPNGDSLALGRPWSTSAPPLNAIVTAPQYGTIGTINSNGSFTYTPNRYGYTGDDSFVYRVCDSKGACSEATASLIAPNTAPVTANEAYIIVKAKQVIAPGLIKNDSDPNNDTISAGLAWNIYIGAINPVVTAPQHGSLSISNNGSFTFTPQAGYTGYDYFVYRVCDVFGACTNANVDLYIFASNGAENAGEVCPMQRVGRPVNVTNGNMYLEQADYSLPGIGEHIEINRFYNSILQHSGLFGFGWSTKYDESLWFYDDKVLQLNMPDGRAAFFGRSNTTDPFNSVSPGIYATIVKNGDNTYNANQ